MTKITSTKTPTDAWSMASSILVGLHKATSVANDEYNAAVVAGAGNPYSAGISQTNQILETLSIAKRGLTNEMTRIARSSGLAMPDIK